MSRRTHAALILAALVSLSACGSGAASRSGADAKPASGFPYTVTNCGVKTTYTAPPRRAVTMNQHVTEIMLELGLEKSMVGTAFLDNAVLPAYEKPYDSVPVLAKEYPSYEKLLAANPDFVYGGYRSAFTASEGRSRGALAESGIRTRLNIEGCTSGPVGLDELYREVEEIGRTFGVRDRAEKWVAGAKAEVESSADRAGTADPLSVFVYDSGEKTAFTAGGTGIGNEIIERAGGRNVFADLKKSFGDASWENVVARRPDVIVIYDYAGESVEEKKRRLLDDPVLADVPAIKNRRFAVLPLSDAVLGVRAPAAIGALAGQLEEFRAG